MSAHLNTQPSTPFGHAFHAIGFWHPNIEDGIVSLYEKLHNEEKGAVTTASGIIAIVNDNLKAAPDFIFDILQKKFPALSKGYITEKLNDLNRLLLKIDANVPDTFEDGLSKLQEYLSRYEGNTWISVTRSVVSVLTDIFLNGKSPVQVIETVLEHVYQTFVKGKVTA